jgi:hypothetical protein
MPKKASYTHRKADAKKDLKREQAEERQAKYESLSRAEKIALVTNRGGSAKELTRVKVLKK